MIQRIVQQPGQPDQQPPGEIPAPRPSEAPPIEPDRIIEPDFPETPPPQPEQPGKRPPEYPARDKKYAS